MKRSKNENQVFESTKFTPEMLENQLWDVLSQVRSKKIKPTEANSVISAAKELCNLSRLRLQYRLLEGDTLDGRPKKVLE
jgi:hypothetical protein